MNKQDERRKAWTRNQLISLTALVLTILGVITGGAIGFAEQGKDIAELQKNYSKLEQQTPFIIEIRTLTAVFKETIRDFRQAMKENSDNLSTYMRENESRYRELEKKMHQFQITQNDIINKVNNSKHKHKGK